MGSRISRFLMVAGAALIGSVPASSLAALGDSLVATGGPITATFEGASAAYDSTLQLMVNGQILGVALADHGTASGATFALGSLALGTLLDVQLHVANTDDTWHTGPASSNADGIAHANVIYNWNGTGRTFVAFEDQRGGGDKDYNDFMLSFTNVSAAPVIAAIPEPGNYAMLFAGLGLLAFLARPKKAKTA